ncbi:hypothetical protein K1X84_15605 [bacterium]|nr:hypothetical protein [bacterium]
MRFFLIPLLFLTLFACDNNDENNVKKAGTIKFIELEGGFYGIAGDDSVKYDPVNLNEQFMQDGLRVRFKGYIDHSVGTVHMWGYSLIITNMEIETWPVDFQ